MPSSEQPDHLPALIYPYVPERRAAPQRRTSSSSGAGARRGGRSSAQEDQYVVAGLVTSWRVEPWPVVA